MNDVVRMPIKTSREGNKITKVCVEDIYKLINRVQEAMDKAYENSVDIVDSVHKEVDGFEGELIIGRGTSQPCLTDAFDEEIGNNIAFMKAKLNANIKKYNIVRRVFMEYIRAIDSFEEELDRIECYINFDLEGIREYNPEYLIDKFPENDEV